MNDEISPQDAILIRLLASTDSIWTPSRESHGLRFNPAVTNAYELRKQFREAGVAWHSGSTTDAERKEAQRSLEDLKEAAAVVGAKPNGTKTLFAKLSDDAYDRTRRQCGLSSYFFSYLMLRIVARFSVRPAKFMQDVWVAETRLTSPGGSLAQVHSRTVPALVRGWLTTNCDSQGRVYFAVTSEGWNLVESGERPTVVADFEQGPQFVAAYRDCLAAERSKLARRKPDDDCELGWLPLPVCHHNIPIAR